MIFDFCVTSNQDHWHSMFRLRMRCEYSPGGLWASPNTPARTRGASLSMIPRIIAIVWAQCALAALFCQCDALMFNGTIETQESWAYLAHFAYKANRESIVYEMDNRNGGPEPSTFDDQMGVAKTKVVDKGVFSATFRYEYGTRLTLLGYFENPSSSSTAKTHKESDFDKASSWEDVYVTSRDCQWRDMQARRHGNAWDLTVTPAKGSDNVQKLGYTNHGLWMSKTGQGNPTSHSSQWVKRDVFFADIRSASASGQLSQNSIAEIDAQFRFRFLNMTIEVSTKRDRYIYFAVANCLPGRQITAEEADSGVSKNPLYRVTSKGHKQQLVCAGTSTFCQGPLIGISFSMSMHQPTVAKEKVTNTNLGADAQGEIVSLIPILICQTILQAWMIYLISRLSQMHNNITSSKTRGSSRHKRQQGAQVVSTFSDHNWGTLTKWHNQWSNAQGQNRSSPSSEALFACPSRQCSRDRPIFSLVYVSSLLHLLTVLLRIWYFAELGTSNAVTTIDINDWVVFGGARPVRFPVAILVVSDLLFVVSRVAFLLSLLLLAKGWKTVRRKISARGRVKLAWYTTSYMMLMLTCFFWEHFVQDQALAKVRYGSGPGMVVLLARSATAVWFGYACITTIRRKGNYKKTGFYRKFCSFYLLYLFLLPIFVVASSSISIIWRYTAIITFDHASQFAASAVLTMIWIPSQIHKNFPVLGSDRWTQKTARSRNWVLESQAAGVKKVKSSEDMEEDRLHAIKVAKSLIFKFRRIRDQAEDVEKIIYRFKRDGLRRRVGMPMQSASKNRVQEEEEEERGRHIEMVSRVYDRKDPDSTSAVIARAIPKENAHL